MLCANQANERLSLLLVCERFVVENLHSHFRRWFSGLFNSGLLSRNSNEECFNAINRWRAAAAATDHAHWRHVRKLEWWGLASLAAGISLSELADDAQIDFAISGLRVLMPVILSPSYDSSLRSGWWWNLVNFRDLSHVRNLYLFFWKLIEWILIITKPYWLLYIYIIEVSH